MKEMKKPVGIVIHHSLTKDGSTVDWDAIKKYHIEVNGWDDIGYHAGIERVKGTVTAFTGRDIDKEGAHTHGHNDMIGICVVGNFDVAPPDDELLRGAATLTAAYLRFANLTIDTVHRHHDYAEKSCPGKLFPWDKFIGLVKQKLED